MNEVPTTESAAASHVCAVCARRLPLSHLRPAVIIRPTLIELIKAENPEWNDQGQIYRDDLARYRRLYIENLLEDERGELSHLDKAVLASLESGDPVAENVAALSLEQRTFGQKAADIVAAVGDSWGVILSFVIILAIWITINAVGIHAKPFDPYPFILLNLVLSCVAALQAPIIMMSQSREDAKDRLRAENDCKVNLKGNLKFGNCMKSSITNLPNSGND